MKIIPFDYQGQPVQFNDAGWFNATVAAARFGKEPGDWLRQRDTVEYLAALAEHGGNSGFVEEFNKIIGLPSASAASQAKLLKLSKQTGYVRTKAGGVEAGGGTWLHPKLAVAFARWLDVRFAVWCDGQIDRLMRGEPETTEQRRLARHQSSAAYVLMCDVLQDSRKAEGKASQPYHFSNEALLVNEVVTGQRHPLNRNGMSKAMLDDLAAVETHNARLILQGLGYAERKAALRVFMAARHEPRRLAA